MKDKKVLRTNYLPAIVMLLAGFIYCVMGITDDIPVTDFMVQLLIVLLIFYILGGIIKLLLDYLMKLTATKEETTEEGSENADENANENEKGNENKTAEGENIQTEGTNAG